MALPEAERRTTPTPLKGCQPGSSTQSRPYSRLEATMGSADARHSVPDFPRPGTWSQRSGANFPTFADELRALPHPILFLNVRLARPMSGPQRPSGGAPVVGLRRRPARLPLSPSANRPPVSPGNSGPTTHSRSGHSRSGHSRSHCRSGHCRSAHGPHAETGETAAVPAKRRLVSHQDHLSHRWVPHLASPKAAPPRSVSP